MTASCKVVPGGQSFPDFKSVPSLSINHLGATDKSLVQKGFFKNRVGNF